jgi:ferritin-like metal-binding protein YciE
MDSETLKKNFENQLAETNKQIGELESNLVKAREYKMKLEGGLETLGLLEGESEAPAEEAPAE